MIFGVGVDIEEHQRFIKYCNPELDSSVLLSIYTEKELLNYKKYNSHLCHAISFSCKEACFKAFGMSWNNSPIEWHNFELIFNEAPELNKTELIISGYASELIEVKNIILPLDYRYTLTKQNVVFEVIVSCKIK